MEETNWNVLQILPEAIVIVDHEHNIQFMNSAAIALFGVFDVGDFTSKPLSTLSGGAGLMTYEKRVEFVNQINKSALNKVSNPEPDDEQRWIGGPEGKQFYFLAIPFRFADHSKTGFVIRINDLTNERKAISYLTNLPSEMASPLESIRGYVELLQLERFSHNLTEEQRGFVAYIKNGCQKLLELRRDIIDFNNRVHTEDESQI